MVRLEGPNGASHVFTVRTNGVFGMGNLPAGSYTVVPSGSGEKAPCVDAKAAAQKNSREQFANGYRAGFTDLRKDCQKQPPQGTVDPNFEKGFNAGAAAAEKRFCTN
ncbi:hypothetical protein [Streptomyces sp. NBC_01408]|uniref:hypothetical protein n=1 Tax=Streptomyces sp. NBC_01408 TaxID=2903855 RepID=UPI002253D446|nr:hypothetical protein [Streptomyces sp. NBC_01408]MCX4696389.1 hypothetical protein [Streptomyces sp. NBC_01408]